MGATWRQGWYDPTLPSTKVSTKLAHKQLRNRNLRTNRMTDPLSLLYIQIYTYPSSPHPMAIIREEKQSFTKDWKRLVVVTVVVDSGYVSGFKIGNSSPIPAQYRSLRATVTHYWKVSTTQINNILSKNGNVKFLRGPNMLDAAGHWENFPTCFCKYLGKSHEIHPGPAGH